MERVEIKSPCSESWENMAGGQAIRHCSKCQFNVYNFDAMTEKEIEKVLHNGERVCARLFVRPDGTYMTKDCHSKKKKKRFLYWIGLAALLPVSFFLFKSKTAEKSVDQLRGVPVIGDIVNKIKPVEVNIVMGEMICPPQQKTPPTGNSSAQ